MTGFDGSAHAAPASSSDFRDAILSQHDLLRDLLVQTADLADATARSGADFGTLRTRAQALFRTLEEHLAFEEQAFPHALRDVIGWGGVLQAQIEENHARQRRALAAALSALAEDAAPVAMAHDVRAFANSVLGDIEQEDSALLGADLDAIYTDSEGG